MADTFILTNKTSAMQHLIDGPKDCKGLIRDFKTRKKK